MIHAVDTNDEDLSFDYAIYSFEKARVFQELWSKSCNNFPIIGKDQVPNKTHKDPKNMSPSILKDM